MSAVLSAWGVGSGVSVEVRDGEGTDIGVDESGGGCGHMWGAGAKGNFISIGSGELMT